MSELFSQLGVDWKLLISQAANFFILLAALTFLIYRPLARVMEERRKKIEFGIEGAGKAEEKLKEAEKIKEEKVSEGERAALKIIGGAEGDAKKRFSAIVAEAEKKAEDVLKESAVIAEHQKQEAMQKLMQEAGMLVRESIGKAVSERPESVDEKLVQGAVAAIKSKNI